MELSINRLTHVQSIPQPPGFLRRAEERDRALLIDWYRTFADEAFHNFAGDIARWVDRDLEQQKAYLWIDQDPVSIAAGFQVDNMGRIGPVYTPLKFRRKGYASACVAALSQHLLNQGCQECYLFTDITNPTSNHIYQAIGYQPICNWYEYKFQNFP